MINKYTTLTFKNAKRAKAPVADAQRAIKRSRELLQQAEDAVSRSYAVVELSKIFVSSAGKPLESES